ncbi:hypothetical protein MTF65_01145 [Streptomyces sp. APSN-46.1]|uniref:hypothetical protein n=1 Tax=Streptomyces sp. APSN-46.1 TaxID=2929049 RepID=UPI001FB55275|nr:hypothetical protein [Streptomyces sp. APSN-46.1]MCJ1675989.1 hypothetical protein [Streptomyces sp. APSN-46.1]
MSKQQQPRHRAPTPPSEAVGESGDREARQAADEAVIGRTGDSRSGRRDAAGHSAKRQRAGIGREEQIRQHPQGDDRPGQEGGAR